jgi:hypothetical protein
MTMSTTNPYFIRHQPGDTPGNNGGTFSNCPDIIFSTTGAPNWVPQSADPASFLTTASYGTDYGSTIQVSDAGNVNNYVYLRALNTAPAGTPPVPTRLWLMYTESDLALWPQNWRSDSISVANEQKARNWQDGKLILSKNSPYIVTEQAFLWTPTTPKDGTHYCVISMVEPFPDASPAGSLSDPPIAPPPSVGYMGTFEQLAQFVLTNDWFGWRNTIDVSSLGQTWQKTIPVTAPPEGGQVWVGVACTNMPVDGFFSATMAGPDADNSLSLPKTQINTPNMSVTVPVTLPAGYKTKMVITYWQGKTAPPYQAQIAPALNLTDSKVRAILDGRPSKRAPQYFQMLDNITNEISGWRRFHVIGSTPLSWDTPPPHAKGTVAVPARVSNVPATVRDAGATWQKSYPVQGPRDGGRLFAGFQCIDMPSGGSVAIDMDGPDPQNSIALPPTAITSPNESMLVPLDWPPGFQSTMTISYWAGRTPPPPDARLEPVVEHPQDSLKLASEAGPSPTWQQTVPIAGPSEGGMAYVGLRCTDMPADGFVSFSLTPPGNLGIPQTRIATRNMSIMLPFQMPPYYKGAMTLTYWQGPTTPPPDAAITPVLTLEGSNMVQLARFRIAR